MSLLLFLLAILVLLALGVLGVVVKGLLWLTAIAVIVFAAGAAYGYFRFRGSTSA